MRQLRKNRKGSLSVVRCTSRSTAARNDGQLENGQLTMNCQDHLYRNIPPRSLARRWFLKECGVGLGSIALGQLAGAATARAAAEPLSLKQPPMRARAKNVIFLFMAGAPSHLELFDNK